MICPQINSLSSGKSLRVACSINQEQVYAIVDTAADVSLISESLYLRLAKEVPIIRQANLAAAGQGQLNRLGQWIYMYLSEPQCFLQHCMPR